MKTKAKVANVIANGSNAIINWRPFNHRPLTSIYSWANKVRLNDPAWTQFLEAQAEREARRKSKKSDKAAEVATAKVDAVIPATA